MAYIVWQEMLNLLLDNDLSWAPKWINSKMKHHTYQQPIRCQKKNNYRELWEKTLIISLEYMNSMHKINDNIGNFLETLHYVFTKK